MRIRVFLRTEVAKSRIAKRNKSSKWIAGELRVSQSYACDLIAGRRSIAPKKRDAIANLLCWRGATWDDLFRHEFYTSTSGGV